MVIRVGLKKCSTDQQYFIYKIDNLYLGTLLSSLVLLNTRMCLLLNLKLKVITWRNIDKLKGLMIENNSRIWSRKQNITSSI